MAQKLIKLDTKSYEHPFDAKALQAFKILPGADKVTNFVMNWTTIKWLTVQLAGSNYHVTEKSCPELFKQVKSIADILDLQRLPEIYTEWGYFVNAYTTGYDDATLLVIYSGAIDLMSEKELNYIIGHEMGHIKSGHVLYHVMAQKFAEIVANFSLAAPFIEPLCLALNYWVRMSEFTADRAGLLACQDLDAALKAIIKMAGLPGKFFSSMGKEAIIEQAKEFEQRYGGFADKAIKTISILDDSHPWTVMRAAELVKWVDSGEYEKVLNKYKGKTCSICGNVEVQDATECSVCGNADKWI